MNGRVVDHRAARQAARVATIWVPLAVVAAAETIVIGVGATGSPQLVTHWGRLLRSDRAVVDLRDPRRGDRTPSHRGHGVLHGTSDPGGRDERLDACDRDGSHRLPHRRHGRELSSPQRFAVRVRSPARRRCHPRGRRRGAHLVVAAARSSSIRERPGGRRPPRPVRRRGRLDRQSRTPGLVHGNHRDSRRSPGRAWRIRAARRRPASMADTPRAGTPTPRAARNSAVRRHGRARRIHRPVSDGLAATPRPGNRPGEGRRRRGRPHAGMAAWPTSPFFGRTDRVPTMFTRPRRSTRTFSSPSPTG